MAKNKKNSGGRNIFSRLSAGVKNIFSRKNSDAGSSPVRRDGIAFLLLGVAIIVALREWVNISGASFSS